MVVCNAALSKTRICSVIKQNESEVSQIQFSFFWLCLYIICKASFYSKLHWNCLIGSKNTGSWRVAKTIGNKEINYFVWLHLEISICKFWLILLDHITYESVWYTFWRMKPSNMEPRLVIQAFQHRKRVVCMV